MLLIDWEAFQMLFQVFLVIVDCILGDSRSHPGSVQYAHCHLT